MIFINFNDSKTFKAIKKTLTSIHKSVKLLGKPAFYSLLFILILLYFVLSFAKEILISIGSTLRQIHPKKLVSISVSRKAALGALFVSILLFFIGISLFGGYLLLGDIPPVNEIETSRPPSSSKIYDRNGVLLYTMYEESDRTPVNLQDIPMTMRLATLAAEDSEFYNHKGISAKGISRALYKYLKNGQLTSGSTITQQLIKNNLLSSEKTIQRKLKEIVLAVLAEQKYSKDQILEMYLNDVPYGGVVYGVQAAAKYYFDKDIQNINLSEAALLAGLPKSPSVYSPFGKNDTNALNRRDEVLSLMKERGFISEQEEWEARRYPINFADKKADIIAPHFVMYVKQELENKYGEVLLNTGGLQVRTTLDVNIQQLAESSVTQELDKLEKLHVTNAAVIILNAHTGEILAMVGSRDYFDKDRDGEVNVTTSLRQPGSSIKLINYAYALSNGYTPATIVDDSPVSFTIPGSKPYSPKNYDGKFSGKMTIRDALAQSRNVPAVKILAGYGVEHMLELGRKMGITTWSESQYYGLSLTLGGGAVKLTDLARVYATVANQGKKPNLYSVMDIASSSGESIYKVDCLESSTNCSGEEVLDKRVAYILTDILRDNVARTPAFGAHSTLVIPNYPEVAVKTGTSNDLRDNLAIGYNQDYVVAVWVGNNDNSPMSRVASGVTGASPIWHNIMAGILAGQNPKKWDFPSGLVATATCGVGGRREDLFLEENSHITCSKDFAKKTDRGKDT